MVGSRHWCPQQSLEVSCREQHHSPRLCNALLQSVFLLHVLCGWCDAPLLTSVRQETRCHVPSMGRFFFLTKRGRSSEDTRLSLPHTSPHLSAAGNDCTESGYPQVEPGGSGSLLLSGSSLVDGRCARQTHSSPPVSLCSLQLGIRTFLLSLSSSLQGQTDSSIHRPHRELTGTGDCSEHYLSICVADWSHSNKGCFVWLFWGITMDWSSVIETGSDKYTAPLLFPLAPAAHQTASG